MRVPLGGACSGLRNIPITLTGTPGTASGTLPGDESGAVAIVPESLSQLRECNLDFVLCFADGALPVELIELPRHGLWRYHWGEWATYRGGPCGYWEVYDGAPASAAQLLRLHPRADTAVVLREGFLRTDLLSARKNREQLLARFTHWPAQVCRELCRAAESRDAARSAAPGAAPVRAAIPVRSAAVRRAPPSPWQRAWLTARIGVRIAATGWRSLFRHDQWNVGIVDRPVEHFLTANAPPEARWLAETPRAELRADPFGIARGGRRTILCEHFSYRDNRGYIVAIDPDAALERHGVAAARVSIGPQPPVHLSYPFLFEDEGALLCVPESSEAREIALYEIERFPDRWSRVATLVEGRGYADATLFEHGGRWWLAASDVADKGANSELYLWHAPAPRGPWSPHPGNPVKIDVRSARPAGAPFSVDGVLYRPAQDCSTTYGARVVINRVALLTPDDFSEEAVASVDPDPRGPYPDGLHTLSALGDRTLIDGKRRVFVAPEFFRLLRHYLP
jgi:hypothetical protein